MSGYVIDPPFDADNTIGIAWNGQVSVYLSEEAVESLQALDLDRWHPGDGTWIDGIAWSIGLDELIAELVDAYTRHGERVVHVKERPELSHLADRLEEAAAMIRSIRFVDLDKWDSQWPAVSTGVGIQRPGWKPFPDDARES